MRYILILISFSLCGSVYAGNLYNPDYIPGGIEQFNNANHNRQLKGFEIEEAEINSNASTYDPPPQQHQPYYPPVRTEPLPYDPNGNGCGLYGLDCAVR